MCEIDLWDLDTFDAELMEILEANTDTICSYFHREREIFDTYHRASIFNRPLFRPANEFSSTFLRVEGQVSSLMESRSIRAFHSARLTDEEVNVLFSEGIHLSTPESLRARLARLVCSGSLTKEEVQVLEDASPFQTQQDIREGKFWMTSHPLTICDSGLEELLGIWGGEVASFHLQDDLLKSKLSTIGRPRVVEVAVPLSITQHTHCSASAAIATFSARFGHTSDRKEFDLYVTSPLPSRAILRINSAGDESFEQLGRSYPESFESGV